MNQEQYAAPKLTLVGDTDDLVHGLADTGADHDGLISPSEMEFAAD